MSTTDLRHIVDDLTRPGGALDLGHDAARLIVRMLHMLATGGAVSEDQAKAAAADLGVDATTASTVLAAWTERNDAGKIVGLGLTRNPTPHRVGLNGETMWTWCAMDTLIFANVLQEELQVESTAPVTGEVVRLEASPGRVGQLSPADAVITWPARTSDQVDLTSNSAIWGSFCHHSFLFPSRSQAEQWAADRDDIAILSLDEALSVAAQVARALTRYEPSANGSENLHDTAVEPPSKSEAAARLSPIARDVHREILTALATNGRPPARSELNHLVTERGAAPATVFAELIDADVLAIDAKGEVLAAYPFSATPTGIKVALDGGPEVFAMCAIDALGMSAMLGQAVRISATDPHSSDPVTVEVDEAAATWEPTTSVVYAGRLEGESCCPSIERTCRHINFFTNSDTAAAWANERPQVTGSVLGLDEALRVGANEFGPLMGRSETRSRSRAVPPVNRARS